MTFSFGFGAQLAFYVRDVVSFDLLKFVYVLFFDRCWVCCFCFMVKFEREGGFQGVKYRVDVCGFVRY